MILFRYTTTSPINLEGNDIDFKQFQPTRPGYTDVTIKATATRPLIGPQRRPAPKRPPVVIENRPVSYNISKKKKKSIFISQKTHFFDIFKVQKNIFLLFQKTAINGTKEKF